MKRVWNFKKGEDMEILVDIHHELFELLDKNYNGFFDNSCKLTIIIERKKK